MHIDDGTKIEGKNEPEKYDTKIEMFSLKKKEKTKKKIKEVLK